jgi:hypothetical protein
MKFSSFACGIRWYWRGAVIPALVLSLTLAGCPGSPVNSPPPPINPSPPVNPPGSITGVDVQASTPEVTSGSQIAMTATVMGTGSFDPSVIWSIDFGGGSLSSSTGSSVTYIAPVVTGTIRVIIRIAAKADPNKFLLFKPLVAPVAGYPINAQIFLPGCLNEGVPNCEGTPEHPAGNSVKVVVTVASTFEVASVVASVTGTGVSAPLVYGTNSYPCQTPGGISCPPAFTAQLDLTPLTRGTFTLQVVATDTRGNTSTVSSEFVVDRPPTLQITQPTDGTVVQPLAPIKPWQSLPM